MLQALQSNQTPETPTTAPAAEAPKLKSSKGIAQAKAFAERATTLETLRDAILQFDGCELKEGANKTVFADGVADADVMVIGEGPGRDEDREGLPFVGRAGQLLDRMLAAIGLSRTENTYITNVNFWRPPGNRNPTENELALCRPFVDKHIALIKPKLIIVAGAVPAQSLLGATQGITRLRGQKFDLSIAGMEKAIPVYPIFHPAYLLRRPAEKAKAWADLLNILAALEALGCAPDKRP
ncbi:MAG: uracil-DNA glycosylase [Ponticaulis sp.]|nr:uracil-DNA glycosylase [Ponticaulis sp.]